MKVIKALAKFTTKQLYDELERRKDVAYRNLGVGYDYYFSYDDDDEDYDDEDYDDEDSPDDYHRFYIVHKRFWHLEHHIDDGVLDISMPEGFDRCEDCCYAYCGSRAEGEKILKDHGFTELPEHPNGFCSLIVQMIEVHESVIAGPDQPAKPFELQYRIDLEADTPEIKKAVEEAIDKMPQFNFPNPVPFASFEAYTDEMKKIAESIGCVIGWTGSYRNGYGGYIMNKQVFENLPPAPKRD